MEMSWFGHLVMLGWIPVVLLLFAVLPARRAAIGSLLFAWLFLPMASYKISGIPDFNKSSAATLAILLGTLFFDRQRFLALRPRLIDLPMLVWCLCPLASSIANDLGWYDGASEAMGQAVTWGLPYLIGRLYLTDLEALEELVVGLVIAGIVYTPLCLIEARFSPQLHRLLYGFRQHSFAQQVRYGGYRPLLFMSHGLTVALWMGMCGVCAFALWRSRAYRSLLGMGMGFWTAVLAVIVVVCKSVGPGALYVLGLAVVACMPKRWSRHLLLVLVILPPIYATLRTMRIIGADELVSLLPISDADRVDSFRVRVDNEDLLAQHAMERPLLGWAGWGRSRIHDDNGKDITLSDGLWTIALGTNGILGLGALMLAFAAPVLRVGYGSGVWTWESGSRRAAAAVAALTAIAVVTGINNIPNADSNPVFIAILAGLGTFRATAGVPTPGGGGGGGGGGAASPGRRHRRRIAARVVGARNAPVSPAAPDPIRRPPSHFRGDVGFVANTAAPREGSA